MPPKSPSILSLSTSDGNDIEMESIEEISETTDPSLHYGDKYIPRPYDPNLDSEDHDGSEGDEGETALLGLSHRPRGLERITEHSSSPWSQVKGIVIEVGFETQLVMFVLFFYYFFRVLQLS